ncbi:hypothetical protein BOTBODRAFT_30455 [Botryobasidium botryosum FD-172 SS1]|uniref:RNA-dependent RNA polymerase n=1 Tax=Botryobasidium botryosum (strain FD-172 SS1) TaxID=930990 RepID=A0A067MMR0_BOTB1|nr:hypothetical protein BOTBODRAFT_30455 [Botryobasidium botryosum FD-172 SS1]
MSLWAKKFTTILFPDSAPPEIKRPEVPVAPLPPTPPAESETPQRSLPPSNHDVTPPALPIRQLPLSPPATPSGSPGASQDNAIAEGRSPSPIQALQDSQETAVELPPSPPIAEAKLAKADLELERKASDVFSIPFAPESPKEEEDLRSEPSVGNDSEALWAALASPAKPDAKELHEPEVVPTPTPKEVPQEPPRISPPEQSLAIPRIFSPGIDKSRYIEVAHSKHHQRLMDGRKLAWGVQWEVARLVSCGLFKWEDIPPAELDKLTGSNAEAGPKVLKSLLPIVNPEFKYLATELGGVRNSSPRSPWEELDREQAAIIEDAGRGLGCTEGDESGWFGGKVQQRARIFIRDAPPSSSYSAGSIADRFAIKLEPQEKGRSTRFGRFFGSRRLIQLTIHKDIMDRHLEALVQYMTHGFVINGRVFRAFFAKENHAYLTETTEEYERTPVAEEGDDMRISLLDFIDWFAPLYRNNRQLMSKWSTRFALLMSTSQPGVQFENTNIFIIDDELSPAYRPEDGKPSAEQTMTDGCGLINLAALKQIKQRLSLETMPSAIQGRLVGAKGMWLRHPTDRDPRPKIWLRGSQIKVKIDLVEDQDAFILDVVRAFHFKCPANLSIQIINNLSHNGVPNDVFVKLMADGLAAEVQPFDWTQPDGLIRLWFAVHEAGGVSTMRLRRDAAAYARLTGVDVPDSSKFGEGDVMDDVGALPSSGMDEISGYPDTLHERVIGLLEAGFTPQGLPIMRKDTKKILDFVIEKYVKKYHIPVPMSLSTFIVPDPLGILKEDEVHFRASQPVLLTPSGEQTASISGKAILTRIPLMLPTDVKKVTVLDHPALSAYVDILVFPIKGTQSLASELSGGDYDGDTVTMIWQPEVVDAFTNSSFAEPPKDLNDSLVGRPPESAVDFQARTASMSEDDVRKAYQLHLLRGLSQSQVGLYSNFHTNAIYAFGYGHPETLRLANLFAICLDTPKSGKSVKPAIMKQDQGRYGKRKPPCMESQEERDRRGGSQDEHLRRDPKLGEFALDALMKAGKAEANKHKAYFEDLVKNNQELRPDSDLIAPYQDAKRRAAVLSAKGEQGMKTELEELKKLVKGLAREYSDLMRKIAVSKDAPRRTSTGPRPSEPSRQESARRISKAFLEGASTDLLHFSPHEALRIMASYAYRFDIEQSRGNDCRFSFAVAFRELCAIKAGQQRSSLSMEYANRKVPHRGALKLLSR